MQNDVQIIEIIPLMKMFSMYKPQGQTFYFTYRSSWCASLARFSSNSWKIFSPMTLRKEAQDISVMNYRILLVSFLRLQTNLQGFTVLKYTAVQICIDTLSFVITCWGAKLKTEVFISTSITFSLIGFTKWNPGFRICLYLPNCCFMPSLDVCIQKTGLVRQQKTQGIEIRRQPVKLPQQVRQDSQQVASQFYPLKFQKSSSSLSSMGQCSGLNDICRLFNIQFIMI